MRFLIALLCASLVVAQIAFMFLSGTDGVLDRSKLPTWAQDLLPEPPVASKAMKTMTPKQAVQNDATDADQPIDEFSFEETPEEVIPATVTSIVQAKAKASAIRIVDDSGQSVGSGVVIRIGKGYFDALTASHVISGLPRFWVEAMKSENSAGVLSLYRCADTSVLSEDQDADLAHIRILSPFPPAASIDLPDDFSSLGESEASVVWTVDFTDSEPALVSEVRKPVRSPAKRSSSARSVTYWQLPTASKPGMSGSALFDREANLMGIASGNGNGVAFYSADSEIRRFLAPVLQQPTAPNP